MKKSLYSISIATLLAMASIPAKALDDNLVYVAVDPCRIVDTREGGGAISANSSRKFLASGTGTDLGGQGGNASGCPAPRAGLKPLAVTAYVLAVPTSVSGPGVLTAFPADQDDPLPGTGSTVNFAAQQAIGNTTTITLSNPSGSIPEDFAILARFTNQDVVVDIQGYFYPAAGSCSDDMVAVGNVCVDKYEASVWSAPTGGTQYGGAGVDLDDYPCMNDGSDCGANAAFPIFARSVAGVKPSVNITWYQAAQACANAGKRLPTTVEWQTAASGTVDPGTNSDLSAGCNTDTTVASDTGEALFCTSTAGAVDMIGNVWEYTSELDIDGIVGTLFVTTDDVAVTARALGTDNNSTASSSDTSTKALLALPTTGGFASGANTANLRIGFRCAR